MNKRRFCMWLVLIVLALLLCGYIFLSLISDDALLSFKTKTEVLPRGTESITCTLTNYSLRSFYYGETYHIEFFSDGEWARADEFGGVYFILPLYTLWPLSSVTRTYNISLFSALAKPGAYRIVIEGSVADEDYTLYCPFHVE